MKMYTFTSHDLNTWKANKNVNPITGHKINPQAKSGIVKQIQKQIDIDTFLEKHHDECQRLPLSVMSYILGLGKHTDAQMKKKDRQDRLRQMWSNVYVDRLSQQKRYEYRFSFKTNEPPILMYKNAHLTMTYTIDNIKINHKGCVYKYFYDPFTKRTAIHMLLHYNNTKGRKIQDYQYKKQYKINSTFWNALNPCVQAYLYIDEHHNKNMNLTFHLPPRGRRKLQKKGISAHRLTHDLQTNDNHPLLKLFRESLRYVLESFPFLLQNEISITLNTFLQQHNQIAEVFDIHNFPLDVIFDTNHHFLRKMHSFLHVLIHDFLTQKDITAWNITHSKDNNLLYDKFGTDTSVLKKRIQNMIGTPNLLQNDIFFRI